MDTTTVPSAGSAPMKGLRPKSPARRRLKWIEMGSTLVAFGILVQASLAGQIIAGNHSLVTAHRVVAEFLPVMSLALVVVAWMDRGAYRHGKTMVGASIVAVVLLVAQTGLGFIGRSSVAAIGIHVPLGVALLGLYVAMAMRARQQAGLLLDGRNVSGSGSADPVVH